MKPRAGSLKKINKIDKPLAKHIKKRGERTQINKITNERGEITADTREKQRIAREYSENLHANILDNLEEMDKFLEAYDLPKLNREEIENLNSLITTNETKSVIKTYIPGPDGFTDKFYQHLKKS